MAWYEAFITHEASMMSRRFYIPVWMQYLNSDWTDAYLLSLIIKPLPMFLLYRHRPVNVVPLYHLSHTVNEWHRVLILEDTFDPSSA